MDPQHIIDLLKRHEIHLVEDYIKRGVISVNEDIGEGGWPLLAHAILQKQSIDWLLRLGADVNIKFNGHWTPLHVAVANKASEETLVALIEAGADINAKSNSEYTPLHMACQVNFRDGIRILLEAGADVDTVNNEGRTPRVTALITGCADILDNANGGRATKVAI